MMHRRVTKACRYLRDHWDGNDEPLACQIRLKHTSTMAVGVLLVRVACVDVVQTGCRLGADWVLTTVCGCRLRCAGVGILRVVPVMLRIPTRTAKARAGARGQYARRTR